VGGRAAVTRQDECEPAHATDGCVDLDHVEQPSSEQLEAWR
jgi:hypothetical protein